MNASRTQSYTYDNVNRISSATETAWGVSFGYDAWGNLLQQNATLGNPPTLNQVTSGNTNQLSVYGWTDPVK